MSNLEVHRHGSRVASKGGSDNSDASSEVYQYAVEVLGDYDVRKLQIHRQGTRVAAKSSTDNAQAAVEVYQYGVEALGRQLPVAGSPLNMPAWQTAAGAGIHKGIFLHNWISKFQIHTRYETSISVSSENRAEERVGLLYKPYRTITIHWTELDRESLDVLLFSLRGMASGSWVCPLFGDQIELDQDFIAGAGSPYKLYCKPLQRRFPQMIRIAVVGLDWRGDIEWVHYTQELNRYGDRIEISTDLPQNAYAGRTLIFPCLDVEASARTQISYVTALVANVGHTTSEVIGDSALPPSWTGVAGGFGSYAGLPIFAPPHNWVHSRDISYGMEGSLFKQGRGKIMDLRGDHPRVTIKFNLQLGREDAYRMINFFDSRLGRLLPFWTIDAENIWKVTNLSASFIDIEAVGDYDTMQEDFAYVGLKMEGAESHVRPVASFENNGDTWRILLSDTLPIGLSVNDVVYCSRARTSRFLKDTLSEVWETDALCNIMIQTIEVLEEGEVSL